MSSSDDHSLVHTDWMKDEKSDQQAVEDSLQVRDTTEAVGEARSD